MKNYIFRTTFVLILLTAFTLNYSLFAKEYGHYNILKIFNLIKTPSGKQLKYHCEIDNKYLDEVIKDLSSHAGMYPTKFKNTFGKERAIKDVKYLSENLEILVDIPHPNTQLLLKSAYINSIGYNLDILGSMKKTTDQFKKLLSISPDNAKANYLYGIFLAGASKSNKSIPFLKKALSLGIDKASFYLGIVYLQIGDKKKSFHYLKDYKKLKPNDPATQKIISAVEDGNFILCKSIKK